MTAKKKTTARSRGGRKLTQKQEEESKKLDKKYYVYHLIDPRSDEVFYVGKGSGNRIKHHERDAAKLRLANSEKEAKIHEIWDSGHNVKRKIIKRFKGEAAAYAFERLEIAKYGIENLTNLAKGGEPEALKALRQGERFIARLQSSMPFMSNDKASQAAGLLLEMGENLKMCRRVLADMGVEA